MTWSDRLASYVHGVGGREEDNGVVLKEMDSNEEVLGCCINGCVALRDGNKFRCLAAICSLISIYFKLLENLIYLLMKRFEASIVKKG